MLADLLRHPGVREVSHLRSTVGFLAIHGGSLERVTAEIAEEAAGRAGASYYGVIQPADLRWHVPSTAFDPASSPRLAAFLEHVDVAVSIHGYGRQGRWTTVLLGGRNRRLAAHVGRHLRAHLPEYEVLDDLEQVPAELRGVHPRNPVNRPRAAGVQVELPPRVRGMGPFWADHAGPGPVPHTEALVAGLAEAARSWDGAAAPSGPTPSPVPGHR